MRCAVIATRLPTKRERREEEGSFSLLLLSNLAGLNYEWLHSQCSAGQTADQVDVYHSGASEIAIATKDA